MKRYRLCLLLVLIYWIQSCNEFCKAVVDSGGGDGSCHGVVTPCLAMAAGVSNSFLSCQVLCPTGLFLLFLFCFSPFVTVVTFLVLHWRVELHRVVVEIGGCQ